MKANIDSSGILVLTPESETEVFALKCWRSENYRSQENVVIASMGHYVGEAIRIKEFIPKYYS